MFDIKNTPIFGALWFN